MSSNYGYGYNSYPTTYSGYQYGMMPSGLPQQPSPPPSTQPAVGYGQQHSYSYYSNTSSHPAQPGTVQSSHHYNQYTSQPSQTGQSSGYNYTGYQGYSRPPTTYPPYYSTVPQSAATPTTTNSSSVSYPSYYLKQSQGGSNFNTQQSQPDAYAYQTQTGSYSSTYPQTGSYSSSYPQTSSYSYYQSTKSYTGASSSYGSSSSQTLSSITPQQQKVIQQYVQQKKNFLKKKNYEPQQEYYCETCKVGCGSALTFKTHVEGKNHKKRLQLLAKISSSDDSNQFKCEVCEVTCSNKDSYQAHIRGNKHIKTVNLFRRLGKPLPAMTNAVPQDDGSVQVSGPRITFVGGKKLSSTGLLINKEMDGMQVYPPGAPKPKEEKKSEVILSNDDIDTVNVEPVGEHLVKSIKNDSRSPLSSYYCELCECFFNDEFAKTMHCKGRRHRLNYKKKYQPDLKVELPKSQVKSMQKRRQKWAELKGAKQSSKEDSGAKAGAKVDLNKLRQQEAAALAAFQSGGSGNDKRGGYVPYDYYRGYPPPGPPPPFGYESDWGPGWDESVGMPRNPMDDKLVSSKHGLLYPTESEFKAVQKVVQDIEKGLKLVSDDFLLEKCRRIASERNESVNDVDVKKHESLRQIKGVMRVGLLAREMILRGDLSVELVLMCANKPTKEQLHEVSENLPAKLAVSALPEQTYHVTADPRKAGLMIISTIEDCTVTVTATFTSTMMREEEQSNDEIEADIKTDVLDKTSCLAALASLRRTKWFQAMCQGLPSFTLVMRILLDLTHRNPTWSVLNCWVLELIVQKCIVSANQEFTRPGDIFRRFIECVASGLFLPGYPGIFDPCEKGTVDTTSYLTAQQRADLTLSAQHFLRLIAFNQLHLVLDIPPLDDYGPYSLGKQEVGLEDEQDEEGSPDSTKRLKVADS